MSLITDATQILNARDFKTARVEVPEWGGEVLIRTLSAIERVRFSKQLNQGDELAFARIAVKAICREDGTRLMGDEQAEELANKSGEALNRIVEAWLTLSGFAAALEADAKN